MLRIGIVAALVRRDQQRSLLHVEPGEHAVDVDQRIVGAALHRAASCHGELLALVVRTRVTRLLDPHSLGRALDLLLVEDEADVAFLVERRDGKDRDEHTDRAGKHDLGPFDQPIVRAAGLGPALVRRALLGRCPVRHQVWTLAIVRENILFGPAGQIEQGAGR